MVVRFRDQGLGIPQLPHLKTPRIKAAATKTSKLRVLSTCASSLSHPPTCGVLSGSGFHICWPCEKNETTGTVDNAGTAMFLHGTFWHCVCDFFHKQCRKFPRKNLTEHDDAPQVTGCIFEGIICFFVAKKSEHSSTRSLRSLQGYRAHNKHPPPLRLP